MMNNFTNKILKFIFIINCISITYNINAQQLPNFIQSRDLQFLMNPAYVSDNYLWRDQNVEVTAGYRYQWAGLKEAPNTAMASFHYHNETYNISWGGHVVNDQTGPTSNSAAYARFAYHVGLGNDMKLAIGGAAGMAQYRVAGEKLVFNEQNDIAKENNSRIYPDFALGTFLYKPRSFYVGISTPQTLGLNLQYRNTLREYDIKKVRHFYAGGGGFIKMNDDRDVFEPSMWIRYVPNAPLNADLNLKYEYNDTWWLTLGASTSRALHFDTGLLLDTNNDNLLHIGYGFGYNFQTYGPQFGFTHEIVLAYSWKY